jgi:hypothetical protein
VDYVDINPVKHGLVDRVCDWGPSSFHRHVRLGSYPMDWAGDLSEDSHDYGERRWVGDGFRKGSTHPTKWGLLPHPRKHQRQQPQHGADESHHRI